VPGSGEASAQGAPATEIQRAAAEPHRSAASADPGKPPEDAALEDPTIEKGAIELHVVDASGNPISKADVTLGIIFNSVAKGESRKRLSATADERGTARFKGLDTGTGVAYRPMVIRDGATFSVPPFQLGQRGIRALLHVYPVTSEVTPTIVTQLMIYAEVKDERIQIQQEFTIHNFGKEAWVPSTEMVVPLPENFTAFATQQGMTDVGVDAVPNQGVRLHGTFAPGQHTIDFKWQLPYKGEGDIRFEAGVPPHMATAQVVVPSSKGMSLDVDGFEPAKQSTDGMGQRALVTGKQLRAGESSGPVRVNIHGLPTEGPGKHIASLLALGCVVAGLVLGSRKPQPRDPKREREQLLGALDSLEKDHAAGTIGPKTYERARRELIDGIARTFADAAETAPPERSAGRKRKSK
jgi:hypothetical protein